MKKDSFLDYLHFIVTSWLIVFPIFTILSVGYYCLSGECKLPNIADDEFIFHINMICIALYFLHRTVVGMKND